MLTTSTKYSYIFSKAGEGDRDVKHLAKVVKQQLKLQPEGMIPNLLGSLQILLFHTASKSQLTRTGQKLHL